MSKNNKTALIIGGVVVAVIAVVAVVAVVLNNNNSNNSQNATDTSSTAENASNKSTTEASNNSIVTNNNSSSSEETVLWSENGIEIKKATIEQVSEGSYNIQTVFANNTNEAVEFDNSKFKYELADGYVITPVSTTKTLEANRPRIQFAQSLSKEENSHLHLGDKLTVYYGDTVLQTTTIEKF